MAAGAFARLSKEILAHFTDVIESDIFLIPFHLRKNFIDVTYIDIVSLLISLLTGFYGTPKS
jgi:hypothetical protein